MRGIFKRRELPRREHPLDRSPLVDRANELLEKSWAKGISHRPSLDPGALWTKALRSARASGEAGGRTGDDIADFRLRLDRICTALQLEASLNPLGLTLAHDQLVRAIRLRLKLGDLWHRKPWLTETLLAPPILVVGHMRGGTTRVHRLFAADPAHSATRFCDSWDPVPERPDRRALRSTLALAAARVIDPWIDSLHPFGATRPDEELGWLAATLHPCAFEAQWRIPSYVAFSEARDPAPVYREFARILATDAAHHGSASHPRVMKVPQFTEDLATLKKQFPDARLVFARRDNNEVMASAASLVANQMAIQSDAADMAWIRHEWQRKIARREARITDALVTMEGPVAEVDYAALETNWELEISRAYQALKLTLTAEAIIAMHAEQGRAATAVHQAHQLSYNQFSRA